MAEFIPEIQSYEPLNPRKWSPERFRTFIYNHAEAEYCRWWRRVAAPSFDNTRKVPNFTDPATGGAALLPIEMTEKISPFKAVFSTPNIRRKFTPVGEYEAGDLMMFCMPDEIDAWFDDWICPIGVNPWTPGIAEPDTRTYRHSEILTRGKIPVSLPGTITSTGSSVTGSGTTFRSSLVPGDVLLANGVKLRVTAVAGDTALTLESAPARAFTGVGYSKAEDRLLYHPAAQIIEIRDASTVYPASSYSLGAETALGSTIYQTVQWNSLTSPAPDVPYSVLYRYNPKYYCVPGQGEAGKVIDGVRMPILLTLRLVTPETHRG